MKIIVLKVRWSVKERLRKNLRLVRDAGTKLRYLMIFNVLHGRSCHETATVLKVHHTTVGRVVKRFARMGKRVCRTAVVTTVKTNWMKPFSRNWTW